MDTQVELLVPSRVVVVCLEQQKSCHVTWDGMQGAKWDSRGRRCLLYQDLLSINRGFGGALGVTLTDAADPLLANSAASVGRRANVFVHPSSRVGNRNRRLFPGLLSSSEAMLLYNNLRSSPLELFFCFSHPLSFSSFFISFQFLSLTL